MVPPSSWSFQRYLFTFPIPEDYAQRFDIAIVMRIVRYLSFIILILGPSVYIALTTFHYEMVPTLLLISLVAQREGVPFPAFVEAMLMEIVFEILREAGVRMPRAIGQTVSVVGALILGQAVVEAGLITPAMVIVVALTGIASFAIPAYNLSIAGRLIRFAFMVLAGLFGFYGLTLGLIILVAHMNSLRSFGVPYLSPISPFRLRNQKTLSSECLSNRSKRKPCPHLIRAVIEVQGSCIAGSRESIIRFTQSECRKG